MAIVEKIGITSDKYEQKVICKKCNAELTIFRHDMYIKEIDIVNEFKGIHYECPCCEREIFMYGIEKTEEEFIDKHIERVKFT